MQQIIGDFLNKHQIKETSFAIGVSGGADSLALALMFRFEFPDYKLIALTVDHQLRPSSAEEAKYVSRVMKRYHIEHHTLIWDGEKPQTGIEEQARIARYNLLCDWCKENNVPYLVTAHHLRDQAETFLMRLQRGSGLLGLAAMKDIVLKNGITILRPLLHVAPDKLKEFLLEKDILWIEDESNDCLDFLRVRLRQFLPVLEKETGITLQRIELAVKNLQETRDFIEYLVKQTINDKVHFWDHVGCSFDYAEFMSWHKELKFHILNQLLTEIGENDYFPEALAVNKLIQALLLSDFSGYTLGGTYIQIDNSRIWIIKEERKKNVSFSNTAWEAFTKKNPEVRGIKIPFKLKQALVCKK